MQRLSSLLTEASISITILAKDPPCPNLIARYHGRGAGAPLLVYGQVNMATTMDQIWKYPPCEARTADVSIWGQGALDGNDGAGLSFLRLSLPTSVDWGIVLAFSLLGEVSTEISNPKLRER